MALTNEKQVEAPDVYDDGYLRVEHHKFYAACAGQPLDNLTRKEFLILSRLVREIGRAVPLLALGLAVWGGGSGFDNKRYNSLRAHVCYLRRKLEPFGLHILTRPNIGYQLSNVEHLSDHQQMDSD